MNWTPALRASTREASSPWSCSHNRRSYSPTFFEIDAAALENPVRERQELFDGYSYRLDGNSVSLPEVAEWIKLERLCCPFLTPQLEASGQAADWRLNLRGPAGVKAILDQEFPLRK